MLLARSCTAEEVRLFSLRMLHVITAKYEHSESHGNTMESIGHATLVL